MNCVKGDNQSLSSNILSHLVPIFVLSHHQTCHCLKGNFLTLQDDNFALKGKNAQCIFFNGSVAAINFSIDVHNHIYNEWE